MRQCKNFDLNPRSYKTFLTSLSVVTTIINVFAIYCVIKKSSKLFGSYKWWLLIYQVSSTAFDVSYSVIVLPVVFFPIPMGYSDSLFANWTSLSNDVALIIFATSFIFLAVTILSLFIYRCHAIVPHGSFLKTNQGGLVVICLILFIIYFVPVMATLANVFSNQAEAREWVLNTYSCARSAIDAPRLTIYIQPKILNAIYTVTALSCVAFIIGILTISASFYFLNSTSAMSDRTRRMQRRFLITLCIQITIPLITLLIPIVVALWKTDSQATGNLVMSGFGLHGLTAPMSLLLCNESYREFTFKMLGMRYLQRQFSKNQSVMTKTVSTTMICIQLYAAERETEDTLPDDGWRWRCSLTCLSPCNHAVFSQTLYLAEVYT